MPFVGTDEETDYGIIDIRSNHAVKQKMLDAGIRIGKAVGVVTP